MRDDWGGPKSSGILDWMSRKFVQETARLVLCYYLKRWRREHAEHVNAYNRAYVKRPERRPVELARAKANRTSRRREVVRMCPGCGASWCPVPGSYSRHVYCSEACAARVRYRCRTESRPT